VRTGEGREELETNDEKDGGEEMDEGVGLAEEGDAEEDK
jgi:hypothetical protein